MPIKFKRIVKIQAGCPYEFLTGQIYHVQPHCRYPNQGRIVRTGPRRGESLQLVQAEYFRSQAILPEDGMVPLISEVGQAYEHTGCDYICVRALDNGYSEWVIVPRKQKNQPKEGF